MQGSTQLAFISLPRGQHKSPGADVTHLSPPLLLLLAGIQRPFLTVCSLGQVQACQVYSLLLGPYRVHPLLTAQQGTEIPGPSSVLYFPLCHRAPPGWLEGDETPSVSVSPLLMDTASDARSCFEQQGTDNKFQQTQEPESHPLGEGDNSQTENFLGALA